MLKLYIKIIKCFNLLYSIKLFFILIKIIIFRHLGYKDDHNSISSIKIKINGNSKKLYISNIYVGDINIISDLYINFENLKKIISDYNFSDILDIGSYKGYTAFFINEMTENKCNIYAVEPNNKFNFITQKNLKNLSCKIFNKIIYINDKNVRNVYTNPINPVQYFHSKEIINDQNKKINFQNLINEIKINQKSILKFSVPELNKSLFEKTEWIEKFDMIIIQLNKDDEYIIDYLYKDFVRSKEKFLIYDIFLRRQ